VSNTIQTALSSFNSGAFKAKYGGTPGIFNFLPIDTLLSPSNIPTSTPKQLAFLGNVLQCYINLKVNGDTTVKAGDTIQLNLPEALTTTNIPQLDPLISGPYLVSSINRNIGRAGEKPRYVDNIESLTPSLASGAGSS